MNEQNNDLLTRFPELEDPMLMLLFRAKKYGRCAELCTFFWHLGQYGNPINLPQTTQQLKQILDEAQTEIYSNDEMKAMLRPDSQNDAQ